MHTYDIANNNYICIDNTYRDRDIDMCIYIYREREIYT